MSNWTDEQFSAVESWRAEAAGMGDTEGAAFWDAFARGDDRAADLAWNAAATTTREAISTRLHEFATDSHPDGVGAFESFTAWAEEAAVDAAVGLADEWVGEGFGEMVEGVAQGASRMGAGSGPSVLGDDVPRPTQYGATPTTGTAGNMTTGPSVPPGGMPAVVSAGSGQLVWNGTGYVPVTMVRNVRLRSTTLRGVLQAAASYAGHLSGPGPTKRAEQLIDDRLTTALADVMPRPVGSMSFLSIETDADWLYVRASVESVVKAMLAEMSIEDLALFVMAGGYALNKKGG